ncbi:MAG: hypothetical protein ACI8RN_002991 [Glaciecola sp.]|jgi:hypothetical protein
MRTESTHAELALLGGFVPAVRLHLVEAYGWFLLSVSGVDDSLATDLPRSTRDLCGPEAGLARIPEIAEFAQLENSGWLSQLLMDETDESPGNIATLPTGPGQSLLVSDRQPPGYAVVLAWADALAVIMTRMDDSLAEY